MGFLKRIQATCQADQFNIYTDFNLYLHVVE